jgi:hypothetical protein
LHGEWGEIFLEKNGFFLGFLCKLEKKHLQKKKMKIITKFLFIYFFILAKFHTKIKRWSLEYKRENRNKTYITGEIPDGFVL